MDPDPHSQYESGSSRLKPMRIRIITWLGGWSIYSLASPDVLSDQSADLVAQCSVVDPDLSKLEKYNIKFSQVRLEQQTK
jgi:hypothetical protein